LKKTSLLATMLLVGVFLLAPGLSGVLYACAACGDDDGAVLTFSKIAGGSYGGVKDRSFVVVSTEDQWKSWWSTINGNVQPLPPLPRIDFSTHALVAVFQGRKNSGGYSIGVEAVIETHDRVTVTVRELEPGPMNIVTSALSSPWEVVAVPRPEKPVLFTSVN